MSPSWPTPALEGVGEGQFPAAWMRGPQGCERVSARSPVGVSPERSREAKAPRTVNGDNRDDRGVAALSVSAFLNSYIADNGAARGSPVVGGLELPLGVLKGLDILSRPAWRARRVNGLTEGDNASLGEQ